MSRIQKLSPERLQELNKQLADKYGYNDGRPNFRVIWSEDEFEKRLSNYTDEGFLLLTPEVRDFPKYKQWIQERYILEKITIIPEFAKGQLVEKVGYEPIWTFETKSGEFLPPIIGACVYIVEQLLENVRNAGVYTKYKDTGETPEERIQKVQEIEEMLFGNETVTGDALAYKEGIVVPANYNSGELK